MAIERKIFRAVGALVVSVKGETRCAVRPILHVTQKIDFSDLGLELDLARSPSNANAGRCAWNDVIVNDRGVNKDGNTLPPMLDPVSLSDFGATTIGPEWPLGTSHGAVYLEDVFFNMKFNEFIKVDPPQPECTWPPLGYRTYELMTVAYSKDTDEGARRGRRYAGVHGQVEGVTPQGKALVRIFRAGNLNMDFGIHKLDLNDPAAVNLSVAPIDTTEILLQNVPGSAGGVFIELQLLASLTETGERPGPKLPIGHG